MYAEFNLTGIVAEQNRFIFIIFVALHLYKDFLYRRCYDVHE
jgi:hypothetical protein